LVLAAFGAGLLGLAGCQEDNEAAVKAQSGQGKAAVDNPAQNVNTMEDYAKQHSSTTGSYGTKGSGYPGVK
jgi:hypothetical protein